MLDPTVYAFWPDVSQILESLVLILRGGKIANRQSLVLSERGQLPRAIPQFHNDMERTNVTRMNANRAIQIAAATQRNERRVYEDRFLWFGEKYDCQRTLVIRMVAIPLASDSAITIA